MPANLTPEQLAALQRIAGPLVMGNSGNGVGTYYDGSMMYRPQYDTSGPSGEAGFDQTHSLQGYYGSDSNHQSVGDPVYNYNTQGNYTNTSAINPLNSGQLFLEGLAAALTMGIGGAAMAGAGAAGEAGAGAGSTFLGEGIASGVPAWDAAYGSALAGSGTAGAGTAAFNAAQDSQAYNAALQAAGGDPLAGYTAAGTGGVTASPTDLSLQFDPSSASYDAAPSSSTTSDYNPASSSDYTNGSDIMSDNFDVNGAHGAGGFGGGTGSWLSALVNSVGGSGSNYGRLLTSLLGGAMGSHGVQTTTSTQRTLDPRMVPYVYGDGTQNNPGILGYTSSLLHSQMQPGALQGYTDMQNVGRGLLNQPVATNGYNRFFGSR